MRSETDRQAGVGASVSRWAYAVPVGVVVVGVMLFVLSIDRAKQRVEAEVASLPRVAFPAGGEVEVATAGRVSVFYERRSVVDGQTLNTTKPARRITLWVTPPSGVAAGREGRFEATNVHWREEGAIEPKTIYDHASYAGFEAWVFEASEPGTYRLEAEYSESSEAREKSPRFAAAVGEIESANTLNAWLGVYGGASAAVLSLVIAAVIWTVIYVKRHHGDWVRASAVPT